MARCEFSAQRMRDYYLPVNERRPPAAVKKWAEKNATPYSVAWAVYLEDYDDGNLLVRTFAAKRIRDSRKERHRLEIMETMREVPGHEQLIRREMYCSACGGWSVYFPPENDITPYHWIESGVYTDIKNRPGITSTILNPEKIATAEKFRFCGYDPKSDLQPISYLHEYMRNPGVEYFAKIGLIPRKSLVNKATKDGNFRKWLRSLAPATIHEANLYGPAATIAAYKQHKTIKKAWGDTNAHLSLAREINRHARPAVKAGWSPERIDAYIKAQVKNIPAGRGLLNTYGDYITAVAFLGYNLKDTKVAFPADFMRMHDLRIDEMEAKKAEEDKEKRKELYRQFAEKAESLKRFELAGAFCIVIPHSPEDLRKEGAALNHCVGRMGYDKKFAEGRSFIAFLRDPAALDRPFVTLEYDIKRKVLAQCYGARDSKPDDAVGAFAEAWAAKVTETLQAEEREARRLAEEAAAEEERQRVARNRAARMEATA